MTSSRASTRFSRQFCQVKPAAENLVHSSRAEIRRKNFICSLKKNVVDSTLPTPPQCHPVLQLVEPTPTPASAQRAILAAGVPVCQHLPAIVAPMKEGREREEGEGERGKLGDKERERDQEGEGGGIRREGKRRRERKSGSEGGRERESTLHPEPLRHHLQREQVPPKHPSLLLASGDAGKGGSKG